MLRSLRMVITTIAVLTLIPLAVQASHTFTDVSDTNVFHDDIAWLAETGVTKGCNPPDNTEFCPGDFVTREQQAAFLRRLSTYLLDAAATGQTGPVGAQLAEVNLATAAFQDVPAAEAAGYEEFLDCFDNPGVGGQGQHYVNMALLDGTVDATAPESMVYEVTPDGLELVGVEYIVPGDFVDAAAPPQLFGQTFHLNEELGVWVLHAWVWKDNPTGLFEDWNPKVRLCS